MTSSGATVRQVLLGGQMLLGPQVDALGPDTRLVTLTAGGNDVGYVGDLVALATRNRGGLVGAVIGRVWKGAKPAAERDFAALRNTLGATLAEIARRSPRARIIVATYPAILPPHGTCPALGLTADETALMRGVADQLAETTREIAARHGATVVDMAAVSVGHDACSAEPWTNGFRPGTGGASFHPTFAGAAATARAVAAIADQG